MAQRWWQLAVWRAWGYYLVVTGRLTIDTGWGRRVRPLGPFGVEIAAPAATVFDVIAAPYLGRTPRAMSGKLQVLQRGAGMVLAEHYAPVHNGRLTAVTLETVRFDQPHRIAFRLVRGPVPQITEEFALTEDDGATQLDYPVSSAPTSGSLGSGGPTGSRPHGRRRFAPPSPASGPKQNAAPEPAPPIPDARSCRPPSDVTDQPAPPNAGRPRIPVPRRDQICVSITDRL